MILCRGFEDEYLPELDIFSGIIEEIRVPFTEADDYQRRFWDRIEVDENGKEIKTISMARIMGLQVLEQELPKEEAYEWTEAFKNARKR